MKQIVLILITLFLHHDLLAQHDNKTETIKSDSTELVIAPSGIENYNRIKAEYDLFGVWEVSSPYRERNNLGSYRMEIYTNGTSEFISFKVGGKYSAGIIEKKEDKYFVITDKWGVYFTFNSDKEMTMYRDGVDLSTQGFTVKKIE